MQKFIIARDVKISYYKTGIGNPVVLLHGFGEDATIWDGLHKELEGHYTTIRVDLPGTGGSEFSENDSSMDSMAAMVQQILEIEEIPNCVMLGHSMGGYVALAFAKNYPQSLSAIGLIHSTAFADSETMRETRKKSIAFIENYGAARYLQQTLPNLFAPKFVKEHRDVVDEQIRKSSYISKETLIAYIKAMMHRNESIDWLKEAGLPVLFIIGKEDYAVAFLTSMQQCHLPKISYIHILKDTGHMGMLENGILLNKMVLEFLEKINEQQFF
jgi:pimeloyl-ACP methyl ester carboxylesterase